MKYSTLLLLLVGFVCGKDLPFDRHRKIVEDDFPNVGPEYFDEAMAKIAERYTNDELDPPQFYSPKYDNDIIGKNMESYYGRPLYAFQGIQYGVPPTAENELRFRPSKMSTLYDQQTEPIMANEFGSVCPQEKIIGLHSKGNEDCLYLNVYTPYLPGSNKGDPLPVMLYIHGGAFTLGDATGYLPQKLLDHDVILVTIQYRLGAFGFFNLDNSDAPGNSALYDMVLSIEWVNYYIEDFGGDPGRVTVFGESAGAVSANYMTIISQVKGMVHGAISDSGSTLDVWALDTESRYAAEFIAQEVGCTIETDSLMYECVSQASQDDLVAAESKLVSGDRKSGLMGFRGAAPVVQKYRGPAWPILLKKTPREYFESGEVNPIPIFIGTNKDEGSLITGITYLTYLAPNQLLDNEVYMRNQLTADLLHSAGTEDSPHTLTDSLNAYYCPGIDMGTFEASAPCLVDMTGVLYLKGSCWECANLHSFYTNNPTYHYSFDFMSDDGMYKWILGIPPPGLEPGVGHADDLMYLFNMPAIMDGQQIVVMDRMTLLWTNFVIYGDPTPDENPEPWQQLNIPKWPMFLTDDHHFMLMQDEFTVDLAEFPDRWTISIDELSNNSTTTDGPKTTDEFDTTTSGSVDPCAGRPTEEEYDDLQKQSDAYLACMIVFIVLFVVADGALIFVWKKNRSMSKS